MAEEKKIVLSIETITDQAVMEAYGKTLDSVLGAYEENIALIGQYNTQIKANEATIKAIQKEGERWGKLTAKQSQAIANLTAENGKLKQAKSELIQITKNQEKIDSSMTGTMQQQSQILGKLRMAWRMMTDEQKKANPEMLQTIQQLDKHLKDSDASIGNFQRNVGNYKSALEGLTEKFPALGGVISKFAGKAGVVGLATGAFNLLKNAMLSTQTTGDAISNNMAGWQGAWSKFLRMIATADFSNFISQLTDAYNASKKLAEVRDDMFEKENSIRLLKAKQSKEEQELLMIMRDQTKTDKERIAAGQKYKELVIANAELQKKAYNELAEAELENLATQTGVDKEALRSYIENYATPKAEAQRKEAEEYAEAVRAKKLADDQFITYAKAGAQKTAEQWKQRANEAQAIIDKTPDVVKKFYEVSVAYGKSADDIVTPFINAWEKALNAEANALQSAQRAMTTVNSLLAKEAKGAIVEIDTSSAMTQMINKGVEKIDVSEIKFEFKEMLEDSFNELSNDPALSKVAESPLARALGVSDEELKQIESQAISAAWQIFSSIAQLSKDATQRRLDDELDAIEKEAESEKAILEGKLEKGIISQKEYEKKLAEVDAETAERKEQANKEAFEKNKKWNILQALMNMALAITNIWATNKGGMVARIAETALATASGVAQIATIAAQKYARGGELHGASHAQGGIKGFVGNRHIEAEGGEIIINKKSSAKHRKLLSLINSDNGWGDDFAKARGGSGRFFARGGVLGGYDFRTAPLPDTTSGLAKFAQQQTANIQSAISAINQRIDNLRVSVLLSDIETRSNEKRVHISRAVL